LPAAVAAARTPGARRVPGRRELLVEGRRGEHSGGSSAGRWYAV